jgi:hypothetical protein
LFASGRGGQAIVDRDDGHDNPPPAELSSFDVSKRGGKEIAVELAARMERWRSARKRPDTPARGPPASVAIADPVAAGLPAAAPPPNADRPSPPAGLDAARTARINRALRIALQARAPQTEDIRTRPMSRTASHGAAFKTVLAESSDTNAIGMRPEHHLAGTLPHARAIGAGTQEAGIVAGRPLRPALEAGADQALRRTHAFSAAAQAAGVTAWRALRSTLAHWIDRVHRRIRDIALAADRTGLAAVRSLRTALRNRLDGAPLHARASKAAAQGVNITGWPTPRLALGYRIDQALRHACAIGAAAWHTKRDRLAIAGAAAIAVAIAGWFLVPSHWPASPDASRQPDVASPRDAPAVHPPEPPQAIAALSAPQGPSPDTGSARLPARLKPVLQAPALATRLKPPAPETADPMNPTPPAGQAQESSQPQETADEPPERGDPRAVDSMVSDGHGLSRRDDRLASATLLR